MVQMLLVNPRGRRWLPRCGSAKGQHTLCCVACVALPSLHDGSG
jgi:hypothetical protein